MNSIEIFQLALQLQEPWYVSSIRFKEDLEGGKELHIDIDFEKGFEFEPESKVHDRTKREWHHLNFFVRGTPPQRDALGMGKDSFGEKAAVLLYFFPRGCLWQRPLAWH